MKNLLLLITLILFKNIAFAQTYCASRGINPQPGYINKVVLGSLNNNSTYNSLGYTYYSTPANIATNSYNTITITATKQNSANYYYFFAWIDFNNNGIFTDPGENVLNSGATTSNVKSAGFTAPAYAGARRMRVAYSYVNVGPCGNINFGEVEDYTVNVYTPLYAPTWGGGGISRTGQFSSVVTLKCAVIPGATQYVFQYHGGTYTSQYPEYTLYISTSPENLPRTFYVQGKNAYTSSPWAQFSLTASFRLGDLNAEANTITYSEGEVKISNSDKNLWNVSIINMQGKVLSNVSTSNEEITINTSGFENGLYIVKILSASGEALERKILINK